MRRQEGAEDGALGEVVIAHAPSVYEHMFDYKTSAPSNAVRAGD